MREEVYAVGLHGAQVGLINRRGKLTKFVLDRDYWDRTDRGVLGQWFEDHRRERPRATNRVPAWFSNLLPEGRLRELIAREQGVSTFGEMDLLARIGEDLPGAVTIRLQGDNEVPGGFEDAAARDVVRASVTGAPRRASLAGMALKFSMSRQTSLHGDRLVVPVPGQDGDWILKTPDAQYPGLVPNELAIMDLARQVGIDVPETARWDHDAVDGLGPVAWPTQETQAYGIRRFDRSLDGRIHMEDFAQVLGRYGAGEGKYSSTVETVAALAYRGWDHDSLREMVRRTVFNLLVGNGDAHLKNWSLIYPDRRTARLSPAYDLVCTAAYPVHAELGLAFFGETTLEGVARESFTQLQTVLRVGDDDVLAVVDEAVERFREVWAGGVDTPDPVRAWIEEHLESTTRRLSSRRCPPA